jgi:ABC-type sugar transport system substrate-binding protein
MPVYPGGYAGIVTHTSHKTPLSKSLLIAITTGALVLSLGACQAAAHGGVSPQELNHSGFLGQRSGAGPDLGFFIDTVSADTSPCHPKFAVDDV